MIAEIICVGTELLLGNIVNTNATYLSQKLSELGINVYYQTVVGDNAMRLESSMKTALERSDVIILTGGLGPTADDITKEIVAKSLNLPLVNDESSREHIDEFFSRQGRTPTQSNYKQSLSPQGAVVLPNSIGTAPGYCIEKKDKHIIMLPGPPKELKAMFENSLYNYLHALSDSEIVSHHIYLFGVGESDAENLLGTLTNSVNPTVATYAGEGSVSIRVTAKAEYSEIAEQLCQNVIEKIKDIFGNNIYAIDNEPLEHCVVNRLLNRNLTVATAESCTGGMLSQKITAVSGSSAVFKMGVIAYSNEIKQQMLKISPNIINTYGAVSEQTAAQMAINVRNIHSADIGVGITGVAGPQGSENKPVGLVFVALADKDNVWVRRLQLFVGYDRDKIRTYATAIALDLIRRYVDFLPLIMSGANKHYSNISVLVSQPNTAVDVASPLIFGKKDVTPQKINSNENTQNDQMSALLANSSLTLNIGDGVSSGDDDKPEVFKETEPKQSSVSLDFFKTNNEKTTSPISKIKSVKPPKASFNFDKLKGIDLSGLKNTLSGVFAKIGAFFAKILPNVKGTFKDNLIKCLFILSIIGLIVSSTYLSIYFISGNKQQALIEDTRNTWAQLSAQGTNESGVPEYAFNTLKQTNADFKAWLKIEGTQINNPVCQAKDNDYYLNHNFNRQKSRYGALFFDYRDIISENGNSKNLVVYGHSMKDGTMFADLLKLKNIYYYKDHPTIELTTEFESSTYKIFSVFLTNAQPEHDNGNVFNYLRNDFSDDLDFLTWIEESVTRSLIKTNINITADDEILTLSTCAYDFDDARLVVMARKTRANESSYVDTDSAVINPSPKYPQIWYDNKNLKNPYSETSSVYDIPSVPDYYTDGIDSSYLESDDVSSDTPSDVVSSTVGGTDATSSEGTTAQPSDTSSNTVSSTSPNVSSDTVQSSEISSAESTSQAASSSEAASDTPLPDEAASDASVAE